MILGSGISIDLPWGGATSSLDTITRNENNTMVFRCGSCDGEVVMSGEDISKDNVIRHYEIWHFDPAYHKNSSSNKDVTARTIEIVTDNVKALYGNIYGETPITQENVVAKLEEEFSEFLDNPSIEEASDLFLLLIGWLTVTNKDFADLLLAAEEKSRVNLGRTWELGDNGVHHHV